MDSFRKLLIALMCIGCTFAIHIWVMNAGWGLEVKSWGAISGGYAMTFMVLIVQQIAMKD